MKSGLICSPAILALTRDHTSSPPAHSQQYLALAWTEKATVHGGAIGNADFLTRSNARAESNTISDKLQFRLVPPGLRYILLRVRENAHYFAICEFAHDFSG